MKHVQNVLSILHYYCLLLLFIEEMNMRVCTVQLNITAQQMDTWLLTYCKVFQK